MPSDEIIVQPPALGRRELLAGGAGLAAAVVLAGCGEDGEATDTVLGDATAVAVGGGAVFADQRVVVTQPTAGDFRAFDITCTHAGCPVDEVTDTINCPCHGGRFALEDGSVVAGPATEPLGSRSVTVANGTIRLG